MMINECLLQATRWEEEVAEVSGYLEREGLMGRTWIVGFAQDEGKQRRNRGSR